jgi:hypothetical protein
MVFLVFFAFAEDLGVDLQKHDIDRMSNVNQTKTMAILIEMKQQQAVMINILSKMQKRQSEHQKRHKRILDEQIRIGEEIRQKKKQKRLETESRGQFLQAQLENMVTTIKEQGSDDEIVMYLLRDIHTLLTKKISVKVSCFNLLSVVCELYWRQVCMTVDRGRPFNDRGLPPINLLIRRILRNVNVDINLVVPLSENTVSSTIEMVMCCYIRDGGIKYMKSCTFLLEQPELDPAHVASCLRELRPTSNNILRRTSCISPISVLRTNSCISWINVLLTQLEKKRKLVFALLSTQLLLPLMNMVIEEHLGWTFENCTLIPRFVAPIVEEEEQDLLDQEQEESEQDDIHERSPRVGWSRDDV